MGHLLYKEGRTKNLVVDGVEIPAGHGTAYFSAPNELQRGAIRSEAENLYPGDEDNQAKYRCTKFWSEVRLDRVEMAQNDSKIQ